MASIAFQKGFMLPVRVIIVCFAVLSQCLLTGCKQQKKGIAKSPASIYIISKPLPLINSKTLKQHTATYDTNINLLWMNAGKKQGFTQTEMDSIQRLISLRKKF